MTPGTARPGRRTEAEWVELLRQCGLRATSGRVHVLAALAELQHATPEAVFSYASPLVPGLNLSTVYRTLDALAECGVVSHTHLDHHSATYMLASHATHAHLVCRSCNEVTELDTGVARQLVARVDSAHGFAVDAGHVSLFGLCRACRIQE